MSTFIRRLAFLLLIMCATRCPGAAVSDPSRPYPLFPEMYSAVREAIASGADLKRTYTTMNATLGNMLLPGIAGGKAATKPAEEGNQFAQLEEIFCLANSAARFETVKDKEMALYLLDRPRFCSRFLHALHSDDKIDEALAILRQLRDVDPKRFERWQEFCVAFAVVWDDFQGPSWVKKPMEPDTMLATYKHYITHEKQLAINPATLPFELSIYVVGTRLSQAERDWVMANYKASDLIPDKLYKSVPWTQKLSPAHGKGDKIEYTLENIRKLGGVCIEQAYFSENVCQLFGVPAIYTFGRGKNIDTSHAWLGVLVSQPQMHWDFGVGRYEENHYYKGIVQSPQNNLLYVDSIVKMSAAAMRLPSPIDRLEQSYAFRDAASWMDRQKPRQNEAQQSATADLSRIMIVRSLNASPNNPRSWLYLCAQAAAGTMDQPTAEFWADRLMQDTVGEFPDFTLYALERLMPCIKTTESKARIYDRLAKLVERNRPDLVADIKVVEGDLWLARDDVGKTVDSYLYPLMNFSRDQQVLDLAKQRIEELGTKADPGKLQTAYEKVMQLIMSSAKASDENMISARTIVAQKLADMYHKEGADGKAKQMEGLIPPATVKPKGK